MTDDQSLRAAIHEEVRLHAYDPSWPSMFSAERERLMAVLPGVFIDLQHIGSTSIAGLTAKPIIDILAGVESMGIAEAIADRICNFRYTTSAEFNATLTDRKWFMRWANGHRTHHLHVVVHDGLVWHDRLRFRDRLRSDPELAARYVSLKSQLAERLADDREAYTAAKSDFVRTVLSSE